MVSALRGLLFKCLVVFIFKIIYLKGVLTPGPDAHPGLLLESAGAGAAAQ